jgi:putative ABC transport system permease protein
MGVSINRLTFLLMLKNFFKVAVRNLLKNKTYVLINTLGMGIAMACCMTAYLLIAYNIEFDSYFKSEDVENTVKVLHHYETSIGEKDKSLVSSMVMGPLAAEEISGIEDFSRFCNNDGIVTYKDNSFYENIRFADESFLKLFPLQLSNGSDKNFESVQSIFLSPLLAKKYFGTEDPIGETMTVSINGKKLEAVVGGVFEKLPLNISFNIDALMRIENYLDAYSIEPGNWEGNQSSSLLFKLKDINQREGIAKQLSKYVTLNNEKQKETRTTSFELVPFTTPIINGEVSRSNLRLPIPTIALFIFSALGFIILLIACFNLTNTTMALTGKRLKEIGVRKVIGSRRNQIAFQFLLEMIITISLAIVAGLLMAQIIVPQFASMWQLQYGLSDLNGLNLIVALIILLFCAATLAGIYPALFNSKFSPLALLKGGQKIKGTTPLTNTLLIFQFSLSVLVFIAGIVLTQNASYQKNMSLGYDKENLVTVSLTGEQEYNRLKNAIDRNPKIKLISGAQNHIGPYSAEWKAIKIDAELFETNIYTVGVNYFETVGLQFVSGRDFTEGQMDYESSVVVDENFISNHNIMEPIGSLINYNDKPYRIIGIVKNHLSGLKQSENSEHVYMFCSPADYSTMVLKTNPADRSQVISQVETEWKKLFAGTPFQSHVQEDIIYEEAGGYNTNLRQILLFLTILGCVLSVSGIYALASLNVQKRTKEIGVRKVLGASVTSIVHLLNKNFAIILGVGAILGGAGGYLLTNALMNSLYAQHIEVGLTTVILCGLAIFIIGISTTSQTIFKTAITNPTETLRNE